EIWTQIKQKSQKYFELLMMVWQNLKPHLLKAFALAKDKFKTITNILFSYLKQVDLKKVKANVANIDRKSASLMAVGLFFIFMGCMRYNNEKNWPTQKFSNQGLSQNEEDHQGQDINGVPV